MAISPCPQSILLITNNTIYITFFCSLFSCPNRRRDDLQVGNPYIECQQTING